jgi:hypothetical protein
MNARTKAKVSDVRRADGKPKPTLPAAQVAAPTAPPHRLPKVVEASSALARAGIRRRPGGAALATITQSLRCGDGWRAGFIGDTGTGKTHALKEFASCPGQITLIHDDSKARPEYPCRYWASVSEMLATPEHEIRETTVLGFRGDAYRGVTCEVDDVAAVSLRFARARFPTRLIVDELDRAVSTAGLRLESESLRSCFTVGRTMGLSVGWATQTPQRVPTEVWNQSSIVIFHVGAKSLRYLDERLLLDDEMLEQVPQLQRGEFVMHRPGHPWDRTIYRF